MRKRQLIVGFSLLLSGCISFDSNTTPTETQASQSTIKDSDGDGVIDSEDYAPRDPEVQQRSDVTQPTTEPTPQPTPQSERVKEADDPFLRQQRETTDKGYQRISGEAELQPGEYTYVPITVKPKQNVKVKAEVDSGNNLDFVFTIEDELDDFASGETVGATIVLSEDSVSSYTADSTPDYVGVDPGEYVYILDNTKRRTSDPDQKEIIDFGVLVGDFFKNS